MPEFIKVMEGMTEVMNEVNQLVTETSEKISASDARRGGAAGRVAAAASLASQLEAPIARYEELALDYERKFVAVDGGTSVLIGAIEKGEVSLDDPNAQQFLTSLDGLVASTLDNITRMEAMAATVDETAQISRVLRAPLKRLAQAARYVARTSTLVERWRDRVAALRATQSAATPATPDPESP